MPWFISRLCWWVVAAAFIAALGRAAWASYVIVNAGESLTGVPVAVLTLDVMKLHTAAIWGGVVGLAIGLLEPVPRLMRIAFRRLRPPEKVEDHHEPTPDEIIRAERARTADDWMRKHRKRDFSFVAIDGEEAPTVENVISAQRGRFTYRVMAYRLLTVDERKRIVFDALQQGLLEEPEPGGTATLLTSIGRDDGDTRAPGE